jgi:hypothetical protein
MADYDTVVGSNAQTYMPWNPWQGAPGGATAKMVTQWVGKQAMGAANMHPMGFIQQGGLYNNLRQQAFSASHLSGMTYAGGQDVETIMDATRGLARRMGKNLSVDEEKEMKKFAEHAMKFAPYTDPAYASFITGGRSRSNLQHQFHMGGQNRMDVVTGQHGTSSATARVHASAVFDRYYKDPKDGFSKSAGLTALDMGQMGDQLMRRGLMASSGDDKTRLRAGLMALQDQVDEHGNPIGVGKMAKALKFFTPRRVKELMDDNFHGLKKEEIAHLTQNDDVKGAMRKADAGRIIRTLDKYKGSLGAIKEIFGDAGHPNAPMEQLWNMLETMTQGGHQQISKGKLESTIRNLANTAKAAGIGLTQMGQIFGVSGEITNDLDLNPLFAGQVAGNAMAQRGAYSQLGMGSMPAWGLKSADQIMVMKIQSGARAAASPLANRMGALSRMERKYGGFSGRALEMVKKFRSGEMTSAEERMYANMSEGDFIAKFSGDETGMDQYDLRSAIGNTAANEEDIYNNPGMRRAVERMQKQDLRKLIYGVEGGAFQHQASKFAGKYGAKDKDGKLSELLAGAASDSLGTMKVGMRRNAQARDYRMGADMLRAAQDAAKRDPDGDAARMLKGMEDMSDDERLTKFAQMAGGMYGDAEQVARLYGVKHMENLHTNQDARLDAETGQFRTNASVTSAIQSATSGTLGASAWQRLMQTAASMGGDDDVGGLAVLIGRTMGAKGAKAHASDIARLMTGVQNAKKAADEHQMKMAKGGRGADSPEAVAKQEQLSKALGAARDRMKTYLNDNKLGRYVGQDPDAAGAGPGGTDGPEGEGGSAGVSMKIDSLTITTEGATITIDGKLVAKSGGPPSTADEEGGAGGE